MCEVTKQTFSLVTLFPKISKWYM